MILTENRFPLFGIMLPLLLLADDADEMLNLADHAANRRRIRKLGNPADLVEVEADQRRTLRVMAADCAAGLLDLDRLCGLGHRRELQIGCYSATASASPPTRRDCRVETLMLRRAATERGESWCFSASKVARTMLYGLEEPSDLATTSCIPSVSNTARMGPPAMMPVPGGAARRNTRPAP